MKRKHFPEKLRVLLIDIIGNLFLAVAVSFFFINYSGYSLIGLDSTTGEVIVDKVEGVLSGGTAGFSLILRNLFFENISNADFILETIITVTTWLFFAVGCLFLGKNFALQTLLSTIIYPVFIFLFKLPIFDKVHEEVNMFSPVIAAINGGLLMGFGSGIIYKEGGSTGGFDVPGLIANKYTKIKLSLFYGIMDGVLVGLALVAHFSLYEIMIGLISVLAYSGAVELSQNMGRKAYYCDIISDKYKEINEAIINKLDRGTTIIDVKGGYTNAPRIMIKTMISKNQYLPIIEIIKEIDPRAFVTMSTTRDVFGEGYIDISSYSNK